jgi:hypothetical protein
MSAILSNAPPARNIGEPNADRSPESWPAREPLDVTDPGYLLDSDLELLEPDPTFTSDGPVAENDAAPFAIGVCVRLVDLWRSDPEECSGPVRELVTQAEAVVADLPF